jgi:protein phosphatase
MQVVDNAPLGTPPGAALHGAIAQAGRVVYQMGGIGPQAGRPGSTCVAVLVHPQGAEVAHVGDSRAFVVRRGQIWQLTRDHSVVQQMIDRGELTAEQAIGHPEANKITRALGMKPETEVELRDPMFVHAEGDVFVLASDGLTDLARAEEIAAAIARSDNLEAACDELVALANSRGGHDNITVQAGRVLASARVQPTLVESSGAAMDKTLVDSARGAPIAPAPAIPQVPISAPALAAPRAPMQQTPVVAPAGAQQVPVTAPILAVAPAPLPPSPAVAPVPHGPITGGPTTNPGPPSRGGWIAVIVGVLVVGCILAGVVGWWLLKGH